MPQMAFNYPSVRHGDTSMFGASVYLQTSNIPLQKGTLHPFENSKGSYAQRSMEEKWEERNAPNVGDMGFGLTFSFVEC